MKRKPFPLTMHTTVQSANESPFPAGIAPPLETAATTPPASRGWDPHEVWRTRVKPQNRKPPLG